MTIAHIIQRSPAAFTSEDGSRVQIDAGELVGQYFATSWVDDQRPQSSYQVVRFTFATADQLGDVYSHLAFITPRTLWPTEAESVQHDPRFFDFAEVSVRGFRLCGTSIPPLRADRPDGVLERRWDGIITASLAFKRKKWGLEARLSVHTGDPYDLNLAYRIPLERLLWRPYAVFTDNNIIGEAAEFVNFKRIRSLSKHDKASGLRPGPIRILTPD